MKIKILQSISLAILLSILIVTGCKKDDNTPIYETPSVTETNPVNNALEISVSNIVTASFSEEMDPATINSVTFTVMQGTMSIAGMVSYEDSKAVFTPSSDLDENKVFTVTITTGAKSSNGIALEGDFTFSFTTGNAPDVIKPEVSTTEPLDNATGVSRNQVSYRICYIKPGNR